MHKKNQKLTSRSKKTKISRDRSLIFIEAIILCLVIFVGILFVVSQKTNTSTASVSLPVSSRVNMLVVSNDVSSGRVVKRTDPLTMSLKTFLETNVDAQGCPASQPGYETVVVASADRQQVLIGYGCGSPSGSAYVVYVDNNWKFLSPTNEFNPLGFPACDYVTKNNISSQLAPVCVDTVDSRTPHYTVRSITLYD